MTRAGFIRNLAAVLLCLMAGLLPSRAATTTPPRPSKTAAPPATAPRPEPGGSLDVLRVGDSISVIYTDIPNAPSSVAQQIREDGKISLHLGYEIVAAGKTRGELEKEIKKLYVNVEKLYKDISINIQLATRFVSVGGEVRSPGALAHNGDLTVMKCIAAAGGFTDFANKRKVKITRARDNKQIMVNCKAAVNDTSKDVPIFPGDSIHVPKSIW